MNGQRKVLILGGSGFIGKQLSFALANRGWRVTVPCRRPHRNRALLVHPRIQVLEANITDPEALQRVRDAIAGAAPKRRPIRSATPPSCSRRTSRTTRRSWWT